MYENIKKFFVQMIIKMLNGMLMKGLRRNPAGLNAVRSGVML